jgi:hypothetical protein
MRSPLQARETGRLLLRGPSALPPSTGRRRRRCPMPSRSLRAAASIVGQWGAGLLALRLRASCLLLRRSTRGLLAVTRAYVCQTVAGRRAPATGRHRERLMATQAWCPGATARLMVGAIRCPTSAAAASLAPGRGRLIEARSSLGVMSTAVRRREARRPRPVVVAARSTATARRRRFPPVSTTVVAAWPESVICAQSVTSSRARRRLTVAAAAVATGASTVTAGVTVGGPTTVGVGAMIGVAARATWRLVAASGLPPSRVGGTIAPSAGVAPTATGVAVSGVRRAAAMALLVRGRRS